MIPEHCIEQFKKRHTQYPTIISVHPSAVNVDLEKFFSKSTICWQHDEVDKFGTQTIAEQLLEYDPSGIMVYIINRTDIFILTRGDRKNVADFMVSNLKRK